MYKEIQKAQEWNKIIKNNKFNLNTAYALLTDEFTELCNSLKEEDYKEIIDAICDLMFVMFGEAYKLGIPAKVISSFYEEVLKSNFSKFEKKGNVYKCIKDSTGKILKPNTFIKPNFNNALIKSGYTFIEDPIGVLTGFYSNEYIKEIEDSEHDNIYYYEENDLKFYFKDFVIIEF